MIYDDLQQISPKPSEATDAMKKVAPCITPHKQSCLLDALHWR
jgi:hypothetical protein